MTEENEFTTIQITNDNKTKIEKLKVHEREPNDDVVKRLLDFWDRYKDVVDQGR